MKTSDKMKSGAGIVTSAATILGGQATAMGITTTFGTASVRVAISTLTICVATKAFIAWLGRGALTAGSGGIAVLFTILVIGGVATEALRYGIYKRFNS